MRKHRKERMIALTGILTAGILAFTGCGEIDVSAPVVRPTVVLDETGSLRVSMVESFDKEYYSTAELDAMVREETSAYSGVTLESVAMSEDGSGNVVVTFDFADAGAYESYFGSELFYGTVRQAVTSGYQLEGNLVSAKDGSAITAEQINKAAEQRVLIVSGQAEIRAPRQILYYSANLTIDENGYAVAVGDAENDGALSYVIVDMR